MFALRKQGVTQTASVRSPYIYAEDNWTDDMELATRIFMIFITINKIMRNQRSITRTFYLHYAYQYARKNPYSWLGTDTANHYQWYPFINIGHYELAKQLKGKERDTIIVIINKELKEFGTKQNKMHFIVVFHLSGAVIILLLHLPFNVIGIGS